MWGRKRRNGDGRNLKRDEEEEEEKKQDEKVTSPSASALTARSRRCRCHRPTRRLQSWPRAGAQGTRLPFERIPPSDNTNLAVPSLR
eukprot:5253062-Pyramimonas_sp.AAC.1